ncbi:DegT/DnrJ/EryC1/StrS family aminotransferase [Vibrio chagasii]|uniref:DegT/DnrJ/EryC1/StrS family aminotransferase n=3 Tax=Vibrio TaxID=662 RepID=UPI0035540C25
MKITVTEPSLPPLDKFIPLLEDIWDRKWLTNNGHYHQELEQALAKHLGVKYVSLFCNGTVALQVGLKALDIKGEVITTPFTFVATTHAIKWNECTPVFCDIEPETLNLDPQKVEELITENTQAIIPVHVYGSPCNVDALKKIADKHKLKIFYDAAHSFGVKRKDESILNFGDLSMMSFHATKIFNTIEGGALITNDPKMKVKIDYLKNFGFEGPEKVIGLGINGKMNEIQAAYGLLQLEYVDEQIEKCKKISNFYREALSNTTGIQLIPEFDGISYNYSYFPILIEEDLYGMSRDELFTYLAEHNIMVRKYFYPLVSNFSEYEGVPSGATTSLPVANSASSRVLCLPIYANLLFSDVENVVNLINKAAK